MKRQLRTFGLISLCLLVSAGIWYVLDASEEKTNEPAAETGEETLWKADRKDVALAEVENENGGFCITWEDDGAVLEGAKGLPLNEDAVDAVRRSASLIKSQKEIPNGEDRLSEFGLDEPKLRVRIKDKKGKEAEFSAGDPAPEQEAGRRYVRLNNKVYLVEQSVVEIFEKRTEDFLSVQVTPAYEEASQNVLVTKVTLHRAGEDGEEEPLVLVYSDSQELAGYQVNSYELISPVMYPAAANTSEEFLPSFFDITADGIKAIRPDEQETAVCGLDVPYVNAEVCYENADGETKTFELDVSRPDEEGNVFLRLGGRDMIYLCDAGRIPWLEKRMGDLISHEILSPDIRTLKQLTVRKNGEEVSTVNLHNAGKNDAEITYGNKKIRPSDFQNFYYGLISLTAEEVLLEQTEDTSRMEPVAEVVFEYENKEKDQVVYYQEAVWQLYAVLNDSERGFRLSASAVEAVLSDWERLLSGEEIKTRY